MIDVVEETLDLQVDHPVKLPASLPRLPHCIQSRLPRPIAKGIRVEQRIYHRFRSRLHHHLRDPVRSSGNPQLPFSAVSLRYLHPPHRRRKPTLVVTIVRSIRPQIVVSTETLVVTIVRSIRPQIVVSTETLVVTIVRSIRPQIVVSTETLVVTIVRSIRSQIVVSTETLVVTIVRSIRPQIVVSTETLVVTIVRSIRPQIVVSTETARRHPIPDFVQVPFQVPFEIRNRL